MSTSERGDFPGSGGRGLEGGREGGGLGEEEEGVAMGGCAAVERMEGLGEGGMNEGGAGKEERRRGTGVCWCRDSLIVDGDVGTRLVVVVVVSEMREGKEERIKGTERALG